MSSKVEPGSLGWAVLAELVARPGQDVRALARAVADWRPPAATTLAELRARQEAMRAELEAVHREHAAKLSARRGGREPSRPLPIRVPRSAGERTAREQVRRALARLVGAGLVEAAGGVALDPLAAAAWRERGPASLARREHIERGGIIEGAMWVPAPQRDVAIVEALLDGPLSQAELAARSDGLTATGTRSGVWVARYDALVEDGVLVPPSDRWPTPAGRALIEGRRPAGG
jgi:hypothetical protein